MTGPLIVVGLGGTILAASAEFPAKVVGMPVAECPALSPDVREAARALLLELRASATHIAVRTVTPAGGAPVHLLGVEALAIRRAATDVKAVLTSKLAVMASQAATANVTLTIDFAPDVPAEAQVDAEKLAWAVTTLVGNALRYMQEPSRGMHDRSVVVHTTYDRAASEVTVEVRDNGPGVAAETVARLFKRDSLNVRGAGLALLLMHDILAAHGGRVEVRSSVDLVSHGTTVRLTFPAR